MIVSIIYTEIATGGNYYDGESGPFGCREPSYIEVSFESLLKEPNIKQFYPYSNQIEVDDRLSDCESLYLAIVRYSTGNSFGTSYGAWQPIGAYASEEIAEEKVKNALINHPYKPWEGYFERLKGTEVYKLSIK